MLLPGSERGGSADVATTTWSGVAHTQKLRVQNEVVRVLVVSLVADVVADVMEKRGIGQQIAIVRRGTEARADRVEELEREPLHVAGVALLEAAGVGQTLHGSRASIAGARGRRSDRAVSAATLRGAVRRDQQGGRVHARHHRSYRRMR